MTSWQKNWLVCGN